MNEGSTNGHLYTDMDHPNAEGSLKNWRRVQELFEEMLTCPAEQRAGVLDSACKDAPHLRTEVESLLDAYGRTDDFLKELDMLRVAVLLDGFREDFGAGDWIGPYRVMGVLGQGGMGVVYLAEDTRLDRFVALKFLPPNLSTDETARQRFIDEAKAAAALDHQNIAVVHEIGETEDHRFYIVMTHYEGEVLREKIARGPLPLEEVFALTRQIAEGLLAAHQRSIVHCDIKPSNILITPAGKVKIVDFGIARLNGTGCPQGGAMPGTVAYMSPEQILGEPVNARTDLWSLGVVFYEMLTGRRPFRGENDQAVIHSILHDTPEPVEDVRPEISDPLTQIVCRCLAKAPADRYQGTEALLSDLEILEAKRDSQRRTWRIEALYATVLLAVVLLGALYFSFSADRDGTSTSTISRIAVMPFENISLDAEDEYFAAGITEELVSHLSQLSGLRTLGRTSIMRFMDPDKGIAEIGRELDVDAVMEGSVRKVSDEVHITVHLTNPQTKGHLWSEDYRVEVENMLALLQEITRRISETLNVQILADEQHRLVSRGTESPEAYVYYLKGRYFMDMHEPEAITQARNHFQQALDLDPAFAEAWAGLADAYKVLENLAVLSPAEASPRSRAAAERALELNPVLAEAHASLANVLTDYYWDWEGAGHHYRRAVNLDPNSAMSLAWHAEYLRDMGRFDEALEEIEKAQDLDPLSPYYQMAEGIILYMAHRSDEAIEQYEQLLDIKPNYRPVHFYLGLAYALKEQYEAALLKMEEVDPQRTFPDALAGRGYFLACMGRFSAARSVLDDLHVLSKERYVSPFLEALVYEALGERDRALDLLEQTVEERSWFARLLKVAPPLDPVRSDPRFQELIKKVWFSPLQWRGG